MYRRTSCMYGKPPYPSHKSMLTPLSLVGSAAALRRESATAQRTTHELLC